MRDVKQFHGMLYSTTDKIKQDIFLLKFSEGAIPQRGIRNSHRISIRYQIPTINGAVKRVFKKTFFNITHISSDRIE
jgi:hypothetical protein